MPAADARQAGRWAEERGDGLQCAEMAEEMDDVGAARHVYSHSYRCRTGVRKKLKCDGADNLVLTFWVTLF